MEQMLENLIYCLNATIPIFLLMLFGLFFRKAGLFDDAFAGKLNRFVFTIGLPVMLFKDLSTQNFFAFWDGSFVLFCFFATLLSIVMVAVASLVIKQRPLRGEFIQGGYRSSTALLGVAFLENLYGSSEAATLMIIGAVPLYNVAAVAALSLTTREAGGKLDGTAILGALRKLVTNPIIIGIVIGMAWSLLQIPQPVIFQKTVSSISATATPLGLMALGASFDLKKALGRWKPAVSASVFKLVIFAAAFLPVGVAMGFRGEKLVAAVAMLASPTTVSGFVMARNLGHDGTLSSSIIMLTTLFSAFTLTAWLYLLKTMALI